jgi:hypothetical protein
MKEEFCGDPKNPDAELILFELEQISQLPQMLRTLLSSPARMQQIADKGRSRALAEHTWKHRAEELHQDLLQTL